MKTREIDAEYKPEWGHHNLMVLAAFRYCLGRRTYMVSWCVEWLIMYWKEIDSHTKKMVVEEIKEAIEKHWAGDECDVDEWRKILRIIPE